MTSAMRINKQLNLDETIEDILKEMRQDIANGTVGIWSDFGGEIAKGYVDRIEAAWELERKAIEDGRGENHIVMNCSNCVHYNKKNQYCKVQETLICKGISKSIRPIFRDGLCKRWIYRDAK